MNHRTWPVLLLLTLGGGLGVSRFAVAQIMPPPRAPQSGESSGPSHLPITDGSFDPKSAEELLAQRLRRLREGREQETLKKLIEEMLKDEEFKKKLSDPKFLQELQEKAKNNPKALENDPTLKPLLDKFRENPELQNELKKGVPSPKLLEDLKKKVMEKLQPEKEPEPSPKPNEPLPKPNEQPQTQGAVPPPQTPVPPPLNPRPSPSSPPPPPVTTHLESTSWINRQLKGLTQGLLKQMGDPKNSPWLRDLFKNVLNQKPGEGGWKLTPLENNEWARRLEGLKAYLPKLGGLFDKLGSPFRNLRLPPIGRRWLGTPRLPSLPSWPSMPAAPSAPSAEQGGMGFLWLLFLAGAALLIWKLIGRQHERMAATQARQWLGPWPIAPTAVRTREELVRAFEYLALLVLGPAARAYHHLEVAGQLGQQPALDAERRREAADHLARVYEKARYAPVDEPLPDEELASARRELCLLAGVAGA